MKKSLWVFGYGSILWKTGFRYKTPEICCTKGWTRRFWQGSTDHRGTPQFPGRVVTLIECENDVCWGIAYQLPEREKTQILTELDYREKDGYKRTELELVSSTGKTIRALTYIADPNNRHFLGHASLNVIAKQISEATGPSGTNKEYIIALQKTLKEHNIRDNHVDALTRNLLRELEETQ